MEKAENILKNIIDNYKNKKVLVIGDSILDESIFAKAIGISLESPTLKAAETKVEKELGGAYNVAKNIAALGSECYFITLLARDEYEKDFMTDNQNLNVVPIYGKKRNTIKKRYWIERGGQIYKHLQINTYDSVGEHASDIIRSIHTAFNSYISKVDVLLFCDYRTGMLSETMVQEMIKEAKRHNVFSFANSQISDKRSNYHFYRGVDVICMNLQEAKRTCIEYNINFEQLQNFFHSYVCVTNSKESTCLYMDNLVLEAPVIKIEENDSCGAGDCFLAALSISDLKDRPVESLRLANIWAGLSVRYHGTKTPKQEELETYIGY